MREKELDPQISTCGRQGAGRLQDRVTKPALMPDPVLIAIATRVSSAKVRPVERIHSVMIASFFVHHATAWSAALRASGSIATPA
jgi:hypothetical protein